MPDRILPADPSRDIHTHIFDACMTRFIERVNRIYENSLLSPCAYEWPESHPGACDSQPCNQKGTIHDLESGMDFCAKHYKSVEVSRACSLIPDCQVTKA